MHYCGTYIRQNNLLNVRKTKKTHILNSSVLKDEEYFIPTDSQSPRETKGKCVSCILLPCLPSPSAPYFLKVSV